MPLASFGVRDYAGAENREVGDETIFRRDYDGHATEYDRLFAPGFSVKNRVKNIASTVAFSHV
jgi:hypothetical protein